MRALLGTKAVSGGVFTTLINVLQSWLSKDEYLLGQGLITIWDL